MYQFFHDHAIRNVWCNPKQDNQFVIRAHRITKMNGELNRFKLMGRNVSLPVQGKRYHIFQVGQITPSLLGLLNLQTTWLNEKWISFPQAMNDNKLIANIYTVDGTCVPRFNSYYMLSNERNLIFAIEDDSRVKIDYKSDYLFFRFYTNSYFQTSRSDQQTDVIYCKGRKIVTVADTLEFQNDLINLRNQHGFVTAYCNGFAVHDLTPVNVAVGDTVEYVYDSSVKRVVTFTVNTLHTFSSILDDKYKYLLHHSFGDNDTIDYQDDIDIYILNQKEDGSYKAYYYHRNSEDSHRMVTHRDYAVVVDYFDYIAGKLVEDTELANIRDFKIQVIIRNSGYHRPLIYDDNRLFELYKLSDNQVVQALTGVNSTLDLWRAENLENSFYTTLMRSRYRDVNLEMIQKAYGYNGLSKVVGDTPVRTELMSDRQTALVPHGLYENSTAYEYDYDGSMIGFHYHNVGYDYQAADSACRTVEMISGRGTSQPASMIGQTNLPLPIYYNYRVYVCQLVDGVPDNIWRDITGGTEYRVENNTLIWNTPDIDHVVLVRTDETFLAYDLDVHFTNGNFYFTLAEELDFGDGLRLHTLPVPYGELDIFVNGKSLIKGLDYTVKFPMIYVHTKKHMVQPALENIQRVHVRFTGFCNSNFESEQVDDFGFIEHGYLSNNNKFDIRDDKVLRITVDGALKRRDQLEFSEEHSGISIIDADNGKPYQVKDIVVPLKQLVNENTYSLRAKSIINDKKVSDYLTLKLPQPDRGNLNAIPERYVLVSPFISRIIYLLEDGHFTLQIGNRRLSDNEIIDICKPYEDLLEFDPIQIEDENFHKYVIIHPIFSTFTVNLSHNEYQFLKKVIKLYARDRVEVSPFITLNT